MGKSNHHRKGSILALLLALILGSSAIPTKAAAEGYCVWQVVTTTYTDANTGEILHQEQEWTLLWCCKSGSACDTSMA